MSRIDSKAPVNMSVKQYLDPEETYYFPNMNNLPFQPDGLTGGGPMWSGPADDGLTTELNHDNIHIDEATTPMTEPMTPASNYGFEQQGSEDDLDKITPSLVAPLMFQPTNNIGPPDRRAFPGPYKFSVLINGANTHKKKFLWSTKVRRMYVDAGIDFPLNFSWEEGAPRPAYVRATVVFNDPDQSQHRVETCLNHKSTLASKNYPEHQLSNVLHSSREAGARGVWYAGGPGQWGSTLVQLDDNRAHAYRFVCKNSCTGGINRRAIAILFTLEDHLGSVYGREEISVRVCACPRRDMKSDEEHAPAVKKPRASEPRVAEPRSKKIKIEVTDADDDKIVVLPELKIRGVSTALRILEMTKEFAAQHKRMSTDPRVVNEDAAILADIDAKINDLKANK